MGEKVSAARGLGFPLALCRRFVFDSYVHSKMHSPFQKGGLLDFGGVFRGKSGAARRGRLVAREKHALVAASASTFHDKPAEATTDCEE